MESHFCPAAGFTGRGGETSCKELVYNWGNDLLALGNDLLALGNDLTPLLGDRLTNPNGVFTLVVSLVAWRFLPITW